MTDRQIAKLMLEVTDPIPRYLLFAGDLHGSRGGWYDFAGSFGTIAAARAAVAAIRDEDRRLRTTGEHQADWWHVIDRKTGELVAGQQW